MTSEYDRGWQAYNGWAKELGLHDGRGEYRASCCFLWFDNRVSVLDARRNLLLKKRDAISKKIENLEKRKNARAN